MKRNVHIVPHNGKWAVKMEGNDRYAAIIEKQSTAVERGKQIAKNNESEILIHGGNGQIRERNSYGNDPFPPKN